MNDRYDSTIVDVVTRAMVPVIQIFALYVIFHGHYSPGGGFQGGALLAGSILLQRVVFGTERSRFGFPRKLGTWFGIVGLLIYGGTGLFGPFLGGRFLEYARLPFGLDAAMSRNIGILLVEIGVAFAVMGTLIAIGDDLLNADETSEVEPRAKEGKLP